MKTTALKQEQIGDLILAHFNKFGAIEGYLAEQGLKACGGVIKNKADKIVGVIMKLGRGHIIRNERYELIEYSGILWEVILDAEPLSTQFEA